MMEKTCIILAGGLGTRLRSVVADVPKCMAPIGTAPFLRILLNHLVSKGYEHFIFSLGYKAETVISYLADSVNDFSYECVIEDELLGTGGAIRYVMDKCNITEATVVNGDTLIFGDYSSQAIAFEDPNSAVKILAIEVEDRARFGGLSVELGKVTAFLEKGTFGSGFINAGIYNVKRSAFDVLNADVKVFSFETDILPKLVTLNLVETFVADAEFIDIGVPEDYFRLIKEFTQ
ncbi:NTP transferase domain-containing protein [Vibrio cholerae]|nr:NTP transferase domain-containing protein [Vibrio cholerae]